MGQNRSLLVLGKKGRSILPLTLNCPQDRPRKGVAPKSPPPRGGCGNCLQAGQRRQPYGPTAVCALLQRLRASVPRTLQTCLATQCGQRVRTRSGVVQAAAPYSAEIAHSVRLQSDMRTPHIVCCLVRDNSRSRWYSIAGPHGRGRPLVGRSRLSSASVTRRQGGGSSRPTCEAAVSQEKQSQPGCPAP